LKDKLHKVVDEYNEKIEELAKKKEEEVMKV
jgi:ribosome recycling factor